MKKIFIIAFLSVFFGGLSSCKSETKSLDRSDATAMYERICKLTKDYTEKVMESPDSLMWASICSEYEDKLDKINFSYPPDTDLLLTEGQNDTIHSLMIDFIKARDERINDILHPHIDLDSLLDADSIAVQESVEITNSDASRNHGN